MNGKQKDVADGLRLMAEKVESGIYGKDDNAFGDDENSIHEDAFGLAFLADMCDHVTSKI